MITFGHMITPGEGKIGFIYTITFDNDEFYIGKKHYIPKGWESYISSSRTVKERINAGESCVFRIIEEHSSKFELACAECEFILLNRHDPLCLNQMVSIRGKISKTKLTK